MADPVPMIYEQILGYTPDIDNIWANRWYNTSGDYFYASSLEILAYDIAQKFAEKHTINIGVLPNGFCCVAGDGLLTVSAANAESIHTAIVDAIILYVSQYGF